MNDEINGHGPNSIVAASKIVAAYISNNHVAPTALPELLSSVHTALTGLAKGQTAALAGVPVEQSTPAAIRKSITPDGIVSFIDGKPRKALKRHLSANGLTPAAYRERYGLPADYPMVASSYREYRSSLAKAIGLGVPGARAEGGAGVHREAA